VLAALLVFAPVLSAEETPPEDYLALVERSCVGGNAAIRALSDWSPEVLEEAVEALNECEQGRVPPGADHEPSGSREMARCGEAVPWAAAAMLHTIHAWSAGEDSLFHLSLAERLQEPLRDDAFRRRWCLAAGLVCLDRADLGPARSYFGRGLELFEGDPALLVALGASYEVEEWVQPIVVTPGRESGYRPLARDRVQLRGERAFFLAEATTQYEKALSLVPEQAEARLRLGRVQLLLGRTDEGLSNLQWVTENADEADLVYLAHLFVGRERKRAGDLDAALVSYRTALDANPKGQIAAVATSHAYYMSGNPVAAGEVLGQGLGGRGSLPVRDSWWHYPGSRVGQVPKLLRGLRREACR
jgi:tetratricopeptide (TPR) repeat protein